MPLTDALRQQIIFEIEAKGADVVMAEVETRMQRIDRAVESLNRRYEAHNITSDQLSAGLRTQATAATRTAQTLAYVQRASVDTARAQAVLNESTRNLATVGMRRGQIAAIEMTRALEDVAVTGNPVGAVNNLNRVIEVMTGNMGMWGIAMSAAVSVGYVLYRNWDSLVTKGGQASRTVEELTKQVQNLEKLGPNRLAVDSSNLDYARDQLDQIKEGLQELDRTSDMRSKAQKERGRAVEDTLSESELGRSLLGTKGGLAAAAIAEEERKSVTLRDIASRGKELEAEAERTKQREAAMRAINPEAAEGYSGRLEQIQRERDALNAEATEEKRVIREQQSARTGRIIHAATSGAPGGAEGLAGVIAGLQDPRAAELAKQLLRAGPTEGVAKMAAPFVGGAFGSRVEGEVLGQLGRGRDPEAIAGAVAAAVARQTGQGAEVAEAITKKVMDRVRPQIEAEQMKGGGTDRDAAQRLLKELLESRQDAARREQKGDVNRERQPWQDMRGDVGFLRQQQQAAMFENFMSQTGGNMNMAQQLTGNMMSSLDQGLDLMQAQTAAWAQLWKGHNQIQSKLGAVEQQVLMMQGNMGHMQGQNRVNGGSWVP